MGCNCGKAKATGYRRDSLGNKIYDVGKKVRNLWEKSQQEQKPVNVNKINKK